LILLAKKVLKAKIPMPTPHCGINKAVESSKL